jgi:hypothetical protein
LHFSPLTVEYVPAGLSTRPKGWKSPSRFGDNVEHPFNPPPRKYLEKMRCDHCHWTDQVEAPTDEGNTMVFMAFLAMGVNIPYLPFTHRCVRRQQVKTKDLKNRLDSHMFGSDQAELSSTAVQSATGRDTLCYNQSRNKRRVLRPRPRM